MLRKVFVGGWVVLVAQQNRVTPSPFDSWLLTRTLDLDLDCDNFKPFLFAMITNVLCRTAAASEISSTSFWSGNFEIKPFSAILCQFQSFVFVLVKLFIARIVSAICSGFKENEVEVVHCMWWRPWKLVYQWWIGFNFANMEKRLCRTLFGLIEAL